MDFLGFFTWLENTSLALAIAESSWMFPTIETLHVLALVLGVGSIAMLDLRLLGVSSRNMGVLQLSDEVLPWTWSAFVIAVITGVLMFVSSASRYFENIPFRIKIVLLLLAGINMAIFHFTSFRSVNDWNDEIPTPIMARVAASLSLCFWVAVVFAGRWIGFV